MTLRLIVFDCDGVLVDSEALVVEIEAEMLSKAGFPITADELADRFVGLSYQTMMIEIGKDHGRPISNELSKRVQQAALDQFPARLKPVAGIAELLSRSVTPRCVASSSDVERIALSLSVTELDLYFEPARIFSAEMVEHGKPAPDLFELAAHRCGEVDPRSCVVIEDSPAGVAAGVAAGMTVLGLTAGSHARPDLADRLLAAGAERTLATVAELEAHLDRFE